MTLFERILNRNIKSNIFPKFVLLFLFLSSFQAFDLFSQWEPQPNANSNWTIKLSISVKDKIFVVNSNGEMYSTDKSGTNWIKVNFGSVQSSMGVINNIEFKDELFLVSTKKEGVLISENFGGNWRKMGTFKDASYATVHNKVFYVCSNENNKILLSKSSDSGLTWQLLNLNLQSAVFKMGFSTDKLFVAANKFYSSIDNGVNWIENNKLSSQTINDVLITDNYLLLTQGTKLLKSVDGGANWKETKTGLSGFNIFKFKDLVLVNNGISEVHASYDNGETWNSFSDGIITESTASVIGDFVIQGDTVFLAAYLDIDRQFSKSSVGFWKRAINEFQADFLQAPTGLYTQSNTIFFNPFDYIKFNWADNSHNEQGFIVERDNGPETNFAELWRVEKNINYYTDFSAQRNILYRYRVRAFNEKKESKSTNAIKIAKASQCDLFETKGIYDLKHLEVIDDKNIVFFGSKGNLLKYEIEKKTWEQFSTPAPFSYISYLDKDTYFGIGTSNRLYFTLNGGISWDFHQTELNFNDNLYKRTFIDFISRNVGFALAEPVVYGAKALYKTINGGKNWAKVNLNQDARDIFQMNFVSEKVGYIRTSKFWLTQNSGVNWSEIMLPTEFDGKTRLISNVYLLDDKTIFAISKNILWVSNNLGISWQMKVIDPDVSKFIELDNLQFDSSQSGMVYFKDYSSSLNPYLIGYRTKDGGNTWAKVYASPLSKGYSYSLKSNVLVRNNNEGIERTQMYDSVSETWVDINYMFFRPKKIEFLSEKTGFVIDQNGIGLVFEKFSKPEESNLFITNNGGVSWQKAWNNNFEKEIEVKFFDNINGVLITNFNNYKTSDGGKTWDKVYPSVFRKVYELGRNYSGVGYSFQFIDKDTWIFGIGIYSSGYNKIFITHDAGKNWSEIYNKELDQLMFKNKTEGYLIFSNSYNFEGEIHQTINGGKTWQFLRKITKGTYYVKFLDDLVGYIFDPKLGLQKTIDGGKTWQTTNFKSVPKDIVMLDKTNGYLTTGDLGSIYQTEDGGLTWFPNYFVNKSNFQDILGTDKLTILSGDVVYGYKSGYGLFSFSKQGALRINSKSIIKAEKRVCENDVTFFKAEVNNLPELNSASWFCSNNRVKFVQTNELNKVSTRFDDLGETQQSVYYIVTNGCEEEKVQHDLYIKPAPKNYKIIQNIPGQLEVRNNVDSLKWFYYNSVYPKPEKLDQSHNILIARRPGFYFAQLTTQEGCTIISPTVEVKSIITSVIVEQTDLLTIYPNPTHEPRIKIKYADLNKVLKAEIYDIGGLKLEEVKIETNSEINFKRLPTGKYILKLTDINGQVISESFILD